MKRIQPKRTPLLVLTLLCGAAAACGPDKDKGTGEKVEEAVEEGAEEVEDEVDDATDDK